MFANTYLWSLKHCSDSKEALDLLIRLGFERDEPADDGDEECYSIELSGKNKLRAFLFENVTDEENGISNEVEFDFDYVQKVVSEDYFDYLIQAGVLIGQVSALLGKSSEDQNHV